MQGKIREIGLSNETPWGVTKYLELSKEKGLTKNDFCSKPL